ALTMSSPPMHSPSTSAQGQDISNNDPDGSDIAAIMGFASFGKAGKLPTPSASNEAKKSQGKAKDKELPTDYMKVFEDSLRLARERNQQRQQDGSEDSARSALIGPSLPPPVSADDNLKAAEADKKKSKKDKKKKKHKKKKSKADSDNDGDRAEWVGPAIPDGFKAAGSTEPVAAADNDDGDTEQSPDEDTKAAKDDADTDEDDEASDADEVGPDSQAQQHRFVPRTSQINLDHRSGKPVVALGLDASGARVVSGGSDFSVRYWNFAGMDSACRPFKVLDQPCGSHQIRYVGFNATSDCVLVASGSAQLRLYGREGKLIAESVKGYQYISNPRSTPGHTHALLNAAWHPRDGAEFATCGMDNSLRLWDANNTEKMLQETRLKSSKEVIVPKSAQGRAVVPSACAYSPDGNQVFAGCIDGSIQAWDRRRRFINTCHLVQRAHGADTVTCLAFSYDGLCLLSRSMDDTLKLWDIRQINKPLFVRQDLSTQFEQTACGFAPNDRLFFTATSGSPRQAKIEILRAGVCQQPGQGSAQAPPGRGASQRPRLRRQTGPEGRHPAPVHAAADGAQARGRPR
ncbi:hypothetical protein BOX15_Mlig025704g2, partial [Macrostomum lignano]